MSDEETAEVRSRLYRRLVIAPGISSEEALSDLFVLSIRKDRDIVPQVKRAVVNRWSNPESKRILVWYVFYACEDDSVPFLTDCIKSQDPDIFDTAKRCLERLVFRSINCQNGRLCKELDEVVKECAANTWRERLQQALIQDHLVDPNQQTLSLRDLNNVLDSLHVPSDPIHENVGRNDLIGMRIAELIFEEAANDPGSDLEWIPAGFPRGKPDKQWLYARQVVSAKDEASHKAVP